MLDDDYKRFVEEVAAAQARLDAFSTPLDDAARKWFLGEPLAAHAKALMEKM